MKKALPRILFAVAVLALFGLSALTINRAVGYRQGGPTLTTDQQLVAFTSHRDGNSQIYTMTLQDTSPTKISNNKWSDMQPAWSSDRNTIAFASNRDGNFEICLMDANGNNQRCITNNATQDKRPDSSRPEDTDPYFAPDGQHIVFVTNRDSTRQLYIMNTDGTNQLNISNNVTDDFEPAWSPDLKTIAFVSNRQGNFDICLMDGSGFNQRCLTNNRTPDKKPNRSRPNDFQPAWSPDSQKLVFTSTRDKNQEIYVMNADGSDPQNLTNSLSADSNPAWSPDGKKIVFLSDREGKSDLWVMNADGSDPKPLTLDTPNGDFDPAFQPLPVNPNATPTQTLTPTPGGTANLTPVFFGTSISSNKITPTAAITVTPDVTGGGGPTSTATGVVPLFNGRSAFVGTPTTWQLSATGGSGPYTFIFPDPTQLSAFGMTYDPATRTITGNPGPAGSYSFTVSARDSTGATGTSTFTVGIFTLDVVPRTLPNGVVGQPYPGAVFTATGGTSPLTFSIGSGALPGGLTLDSAGNLTGTVDTTTVPGTYTFAVRVTDSNGIFIQRTYTIIISPDAPATIDIVSGDNQAAQLTTMYKNPLVVIVKDQYGNPIPNAKVDFTAPTPFASVPSIKFANGTQAIQLTTGTTGTATTATKSGTVTLSNVTANTVIGTVNINACVNGTVPLICLAAPFNLTNTKGAPAQLVIISGNPQNATVGTQYANGLVAQLQDAGGNPVGAGFALKFTIVAGTTGASGSFACPGPVGSTCTATTFTLKTNASGQVTTPKINANTKTGLFTVIVTFPGANPQTYNLTNTPGAATHLAIVQQPPTSSQAGQNFTVQAAVEDQYNNIVTTDNATSVAFALSAGPATTLNGTTPVTVVNGIATFTGNVTLVGTGYKITASATLPLPAGAVSATTNAFAITPGLASYIKITTQPPASSLAGVNFNVGATVYDAYNNVATDQLIPISFTQSAGPSTTLFGTTPVNTVNGVATFTVNIHLAATGYKINATSGSLTPDATNAFDIVPDTANQLHLAYTTQPSNGIAGNPITPAIAVAVEDQFGNIVTAGAESTAPVTLAIGNNPGGSTLGGTTTQNAVNGVATFSDITLNKTGNGYTLVASSTGITSATSNPFDIAPNTPTQLVFGQQPPANTDATVIFSPAITVMVQDAYGNLVTSSSATITMAIGNNPGSPIAGTLSGTKVVNAVNGVATFSTLSIDKAGTGYTLTANATGLTGATSDPFNINVGNPTHLVITGQPTTTQAGDPITPAITVEVQDAGGNLVTTSGATIILSINNNPGGSTLGGTVSVAASGGIATFSDITLNKTGTGYTLDANSTGLIGATSSAFNIIPNNPDHLAFVNQPTTTASTQIINNGTGGVTVEIDDAYGNRTTSTANVTIVIGNNAGSPVAGTLSGTATVAAVNGLATFSTLNIDKAGTGYTLAASSPVTATGATSTAFDITIGAASQLVFTVQPPSSVMAGNNIAVEVSVEDAGGNIVPTAANSITLALNPSGPTLFGTNPVNAVNGVATFSDLQVHKTGTGYTLTASAAGLTSDTSTAFDITPAADNALKFVTQPASTTAGTPMTITVEVQDQFGNRTNSTATIDLTIGSNPGGSTLSGTTSVAAVNGLATFTGISLNKTGTGYTLDANSNTPALLTGDTSNAFNITPNTPDHLAFVNQPTNTTSTQTINGVTGVTVEIDDAFGNRTTSTGNVTVAIGNNAGSPVAGTLSGTATVAAVNGLATFTTLSIDKAGTGYTLTASSPVAAIGATSTAFNINIGAASQLVFTAQPPTSVVAGNTFSAEVSVEDAGGNIVPTTTNAITLTLNPSGPTLFGTNPVNAVNGVATFSNLQVQKAGTGYTLTASAAGLTSDTSAAFDVTNAAAAKVVFTTQPPATTTAGVVMTPAVVVTVEDTFGNTVTGSTAPITVAIGTNPGGGTLSGTTTVNATAGVATFNNLSINKAGTGYTLTANSAGLTGDTSTTFNITAAAPNQLAFSVQPTTTDATQPITPAIRVQILDQFGNLTSSTATVILTISTNPSSGSLSGTTSVAAVAGTATFSGLSIDKAGTGYTLLAASAGVTSATSNAFDINVGIPTHLVITVQPTNTTAGVNITPAIQVQILDAGNNLTSSTANVTVAIGTNPVGGTLNGTTTVAAVAGTATFSDLNIAKAGTGYTLAFTSAGLTGATSNAFNITVGAPAKLVFVNNPTNTTSTQIINNTTGGVTVEIDDAAGNRTTSTANVTIAIGTNPGGGTLSGTTTVAAVNGLATFNNLSIDKVGTGYTLAATSAGLTGATSNPFNITVGAATHLVFITQPSNATAGAVIAPPIQIAVEDAGGNIVTGSSAANNMVIGLGTPGATLSGTTTVNAVSGIASFNNLSIDKAGLVYTLVASSTGLTSATSNSFTISPAAATKVVFTTQPPLNSTAGAPFTVVATIEDLFGNTVPSSAQVDVAIGANPGGGTLSGTTSINAVNGVATFNNLSINKAGIGYTLNASSTGLTGDTSTAFNITAAAPNKLAFSVQPSTTIATQPIAPAVKVEIQDQFGNLTGSTANVTVAIGTNPSGGTLSGTATVAAVAGTATFNNLSIDKAGVGYTLTAISGALTGATSTAFDITVGPATKLVFASQPTTTTAGTTITPAVTVEIQDAGGNLVTTATDAVTLAFGNNPSGATLGGTLTVNAVGGVATFGDLSIQKAGIGYTLAATSGTLAGDTSAAFDITPAAPAQLVFTVQPSNTNAAQAIAPAVQVRLLDAFGNLTNSSANVTISIGTNPSSGTLTGTTTVAASGGIATFNNLHIDKAGTGYTLDALSGTLNATSNTFNINVGPAAKLAFASQPTTATAGATITPAVTVEILDAGNNLTSSTANVTVAIGTNPGAGTLSGTKTVAAVNGVATLSDLSINKVGTGYTLTAASAGLTGTTSTAFDITVGAAAQLGFIVQPSTTASGANITPAIEVAIQDAFGNTILGATDTVTLSFGTNAGSGTLSGTLSVAAVNGVATFGNINIDKTGTGYTLDAASGTLTGATSNAFNINPGPPSHLDFGVQPSNTTAGSAISPAVTVRILDDNNNLVTTSSLTITMAIQNNPSGGTLSGTLSVAAVNGVATFNNLSINKTGTPYSLSAFGLGVASVISNNFSITAGAAAKLVYTTPPPATVTATTQTFTVVVAVEDAFGNIVTSDNTTSVTLSISPNPGSLNNGGAVTVVNGVATYNNVSINPPKTTYTMTAAATGLTSATASVTVQ